MPKTFVQYDKELPYIEGREPYLRPNSYLRKTGKNAYEVVEGRRPSKMLLVNKLRKEVDRWREDGYPGASDTSAELMTFWFEQDHLVNGEKFVYYFCQREAMETLIYLVEVKKFRDLEPVVYAYAENFQKDLFEKAVEIQVTPDGERYIRRYFPELDRETIQDFPEKNLLRYTFKMATGSGKTVVMAMAIVWSYFHKRREAGSELSDNFLVVAPNVIVFERLEKDFGSNRIFHELPLIPPGWDWNFKPIVRRDTSTPNPSGNIFVINIQQIYESREQEWTPESALDAILGRPPQKDLSKAPISALAHLKRLDNLMVLNDEAHHVHDDDLEWNKTLLMLHHTIPGGLSLWLDFSATPKNQAGAYYPWIIVDYPLAQAVEDRIVKAPLIVHRVDKVDPQDVTKENVVQAYGDWITAALERWREHYSIYKEQGKKPVLFIMAEKTAFADKIYEFLLNDPDLKASEILVIHTNTKGEIQKRDLDNARRAARDIDEKSNKIKAVVSVLMLREGWDVQNVTVVLGLRPFSSDAKILPEQAIGRGLRLMKGISPDRTQTLEVIGTEAFEDFVRELEEEGVGINTVTTPPPLPVKIAPLKSRMEYDIEIPTTNLIYSHNYKKLTKIDPLNIESLFESRVLDEDTRILLKMEFATTETEVHQAAIKPTYLPTGQEILLRITNRVMKEAKLTCNFNELYPIVKRYVSEKCFERSIDVEKEDIRLKLREIITQDAIVSLLTKVVGTATATQSEIELQSSPILLSETELFPWQRKHLKCDKTVFNYVAVYNDFEASFAEFLDSCDDIERFAALAESFTKFKVDYLSSRGAIRFYYPDFVAVQSADEGDINWIIETKGREFTDTDRKDSAMRKWCRDVSDDTGEDWRYIKISQKDFDADGFETYGDLIAHISCFASNPDEEAKRS